MLLPPWDELDRDMQDWIRGIVLGLVIGVVLGLGASTAVMTIWSNL